jgi:uncharacterized protein (TIGR00369 family)
MTPEAVPEGFEPLPSGLGYTDTLQPCYRRLRDDSIAFGLVVQKQHSNTMGICHGGVLMCLADIAAASAANLAKGVRAGSPTVNLTIDFVSAARMGQWIEVQIEGAHARRLFGFSRGVIRNRDGVVARFSGTFYFPPHEGMWKEGRTSAGALQGIGE